jgi:hypothetical protein
LTTVDCRASPPGGSCERTVRSIGAAQGELNLRRADTDGERCWAPSTASIFMAQPRPPALFASALRALRCISCYSCFAGRIPDFVHEVQRPIGYWSTQILGVGCFRTKGLAGRGPEGACGGSRGCLPSLPAWTFFSEPNSSLAAKRTTISAEKELEKKTWRCSSAARRNL